MPSKKDIGVVHAIANQMLSRELRAMGYRKLSARLIGLGIN